MQKIFQPKTACIFGGLEKVPSRKGIYSLVGEYFKKRTLTPWNFQGKFVCPKLTHPGGAPVWSRHLTAEDSSPGVAKRNQGMLASLRAHLPSRQYSRPQFFFRKVFPKASVISPPPPENSRGGLAFRALGVLWVAFTRKSRTKPPTILIVNAMHFLHHFQSKDIS